MRVLLGEAQPGRAHVLEREALGDARAVLTHPLDEARLGARDDGSDVPEGIVEIEGYCADRHRRAGGACVLQAGP